MPILSPCDNPIFEHSCSACLQAGTVDSSTCSPEGERYMARVPAQTLSYRKTDSREAPVFEFDAAVRKISDGLRVRNDENRVPGGMQFAQQV